MTAPAPRREARSGRSIHRLFAEQAEAVPLFTAMVHAGKELRYRELNAQANRIARLLADRGAGRGSSSRSPRSPRRSCWPACSAS
ncbi:hypothetical protein [Paenibacillus mucilaginosus]|uniref:hypothetical protein n=1 Tax=Paenibacillus mucilaginosus TaxID=61624 RepID=UPI00240E793C|nr:hypothetical protein [Paenibacillus mucilaginosus]